MVERLKVVNWDEFMGKAEEIYREKIKDKLESTHKGKFIAIDVESEDYFMGDTSKEASCKAREKYPGKVFHIIRIGYRAAFKVRWPYMRRG